MYAKISLDTKEYKKSVNDSVKHGNALEKELEKVSEEVKKLSEEYKKSVTETVRYSKGTEALREKLDLAQKKQSELRKELEESSEAASKFTYNIGDLGDKLKTGFTVVAGTITTVVGSLVAVSAATEEYRIAQGKLNTAFDAAGFSSESAATAYNEFYKILGDTDTATEASQLLAKLAENEQDITTWTRTAAGVFGTFGDALPIEGLIESANETAKVGQITGVLADALNWAGISEDEFNEKLAAAGSESERNRMIMETLSSTYDTASDSFYQNNEQIVKNREQQAKLTEAMEAVGDAVDKVKSALMERFIPIIADASEKLTEWLQNLDIGSIVDKALEKVNELKDAFLVLAPVIVGVITAITVFRTIMAISAIIEAATKAMTAFKKAQEAATIAQAALNFVMNLNPFVLVATLIAGVVAALVVLWNTNEDFRNAVIRIWNGIVDKFKQAWNAIVDIFSGWGSFFGGLFDQLVNAFSGIWNTFYNMGANIIEGIRNGIAAAWGGLVNWFNGLWNSLTANRNVSVGVSGSYRAINGSHKTGLSYVPFDGYIAELHKGERVLTASEASRYNSGGDFGSVQIIVNAAKGQDENKISQMVAEKLEFERKRRASAFA